MSEDEKQTDGLEPLPYAESSALLDALFDCAPVGIGFWDTELRFRRLNAELAEINGLPAEAHIGRRPDELLPGLEGLDGILERWQEVIATGEPWTDVEIHGRTRSPSAEPRTWLESFFPVKLHGSTIGLGAVVQDITRRKQAERALQEVDRRKDEFLAILSHELRNPLAPLRMGLELLKRGAAEEPGLLDEMLPMMDRQLTHLTRLVDDLLQVSRIKQGSLQLEIGRMDLREPVRAAVEQVSPLIAARNHELTVQLPDYELLVDGDFERLTQVVANLLGNAAKYTEPGGTIRISAALEENQAVIRVDDSGRGIPSEHVESIFQLFGRSPDHGPKGDGGGLGIGLTISRQLIEMHGGTLSAESGGLGQGSEFIVRLPKAGGETPVPGSGRRNVAEAGPVRRVLVVDDNIDFAESLRMMLELKDHLVEVAHDGPAALERLPSFKPEVVLLDVGLPGMSGLEVARRIRALADTGAIRIVAITGWSQEEDRRKTAGAGFDAHLTKPVDSAQLFAVME